MRASTNPIKKLMIRTPILSIELQMRPFMVFDFNVVDRIVCDNITELISSTRKTKVLSSINNSRIFYLIFKMQVNIF